jgi:hypothetical protein
MKPAILSQKLATAFKGGIQLLIVSSPGIGKSAIVEQAVNNAALVTMHPAVSDPTDFKGMPAVIKATGKSSQSFAEFLPFGNLRKLVEATELTVCFIDDIGQAPHAVQAALMQLIHAREVDGTKISDKVVFVGATNDSSHMAGVASILEPVKSRWNSIIHLEADAKGWRAWALGAGIAPEVIAFIAFRPELLNNFKATRELTNCPSPRTVESLSKLIQAGLDDHELIAGAVGEGFAIEFNAFRKVWKSIPDLDAILAAPLTAPVPSGDPSLIVALACALSYKATKANLPSFMAYLDRLPKEYEFLALSDATARDPKLLSTKSYTDWTLANQAMFA